MRRRSTRPPDHPRSMRGGNRATVALIALLSLSSSGCWYHRAEAPTPVRPAGLDSLAYTSWSFLWRSNRTRPSPECVSNALKEVTVRSNLAFSLIRAGTLGLIAPVRFERQCAAPMIDPPPGGQTASHGATHVSIGWGNVMNRDPAVDCDARPVREVAVRPNPLFDILTAATIGLVAPARIRAYCAPAPEPDAADLELLP